MLALLRNWKSVENAITRQKMLTKMLELVAPSFARVIQQGVEEGTLCTSFPGQVTVICVYLILGLSDKFAEVILGNEARNLSAEERFHIMQKAVAAYTDALERVLGASTGSIQLMDDDSIRVWTD